MDTAPNPGTSALILFAHGARDPRWAEPLERVQSKIRALCPGRPVALAFLELMSPKLLDAITQLVEDGVTAVTIVPFFLGQGGHVREDLPRMVGAARARFPDLKIEVCSAIGEVDPILEAIARFCADRP